MYTWEPKLKELIQWYVYEEGIDNAYIEFKDLILDIIEDIHYNVNEEAEK